MTPGHFFIIGAQRCGTTYLYKILDEHPEIQMAKPVRPEPKFFLSDHQGSDVHQMYMERCFTKQDHIKQYGEKSTSYIEHGSVAQRIKSVLPDARILVILRNPVDRAVSNYYFSRSHGIEPRTLQEVFLDELPTPDFDPDRFSVNPYDYLQRGIYHQYLKQWMKVFPAKQLRVLIFEQFIGQEAAVSDLYDWLNVNQNFKPPSILTKVNTGDRASGEYRDVIRKISTKYIYHNQQLSQLINRDLSFWNKYL